MSLTNRLSVFFLAALAVVLAGFSVTLYALARWHLEAHESLRLKAAMQSLVASTETFSDHVEWEPQLRHITAGEDSGPDQVRWATSRLDGTLIDCSLNLRELRGGAPDLATGWRVISRRVSAGPLEAEPLGGDDVQTVTSVPAAFVSDVARQLSSNPEKRAYKGAGLVLTTGVPDGLVQGTLVRLAWAMTLLSTLIWLAAAVWGRWFCRKALAPVAHMAESARAIRRDKTAGTLLDVAPTGDEFEDLGLAFNELLLSLREALDRQQRFTGDASHQLRTPLTALQTSIDVTLRHERSAEEYKRVLTVVRRRSGELRQIVESLLFLARSEASSPLSKTEVIDLVEWTQAWLNNRDPHPRAVDCVFRAEDEKALCRTHPGLLGQALDNLLDNALKYSEPGTQVVISVETSGEQVTVKLTDAGLGISPEEIPLVFAPFYRGSEPKRLGTPGTGLGLTVVDRIVRTLGGRMAVASKPRSGSVFTLSLPLEISAIQDQEVFTLADGDSK